MKILVLFAVSLLIAGGADAQTATSAFNGTNSSSISEFKSFNFYTHNSALDGSYVNFNRMENTKGRRYLFDGWAQGKVTTTNGQEISSDSMFYNVDKMNGDLLVTNDKKNIIAVSRSDIKSFTLGDGNAKFDFERIDVINPNGYLQVLATKQNGYILYKATTTKFHKADYNTDGLMETGKPYDEYTDQNKYFVIFPDGKSFKEIPLKAKSVKEIFKADPRAAKVLQDMKGSVDEVYLINLVNTLNQ